MSVRLASERARSRHLMTARRLQRDQHIQFAGAALVLELLDEVSELDRNCGP